MSFNSLTLEQVIDEQLVCAHLGTYESFESPYDAVNALLVYYQNLGEYLGNKKTSSWQPIETAPKDGEHIILGIYLDGFVYAQSSFWLSYKWAGWRYREPTHWMPLPEPPEEE